MASQLLRDEFEHLTGSLESETYTPQPRGGSVSDITRDTNRLSLSETFQLVDSSEIVKKETEEIGELLANVRDSIVEADKKTYKVMLAHQLTTDIGDMCCKEVQSNRNIFCFRNKCGIVHRNGGAPKVEVTTSSLLVIKNLEKFQAFVTPMGSQDLVEKEVLEEWCNQKNTLSDWSNLFHLSKMAESGCVSIKELEELNDFASKAAAHKTPKKLDKVPIKVGKYNAIAAIKSSTPEISGGNPGNAKMLRNVNNNFEKVDAQFFKLEAIVSDVLKRMNTMEEVFSTSIRALELEKEKLKLEVGSRNSVALMEDMDGSSLWQMVALLSSLGRDESLSSGDVASLRAFELWVRKQMEDIKGSLSSCVSEDVMKLEVKTIVKHTNHIYTLQERRNSDYQEIVGKRLAAVETKVKAMESKSGQSTIDVLENLEKRLSDLERNDLVNRVDFLEGSRFKSSEGMGSRDWQDRLESLESQVMELNPDQETTAVRFQDLYIKNLPDMKSFLKANIPSLHFGMAIDYHLGMEHIDHKSNPSKPTLEHLQHLHKLEIPTSNHALAITALETKEPKFLVKAKEHSVPAKNQSAFNRITSWAQWDKAVHGYKAKLLEELGHVRRTFHHMISEDRTLTVEGRSLVNNLVSTTIAFIQNFVRFIDEVYHELIASSFTEAAAWALATALGVRISKDIAFPREGILDMLKMKEPIQCATLIFHTCLKCHSVMRQYEDVNFAGHPNISSEYIKFLALNSQLEVVSRIEKRLEAFEDSAKSQKKEEAAKLKQLNTTTQKAETCATKIASLETRLARLEKK